ncbi:hypothetical protein EMCG_02782 [[Emmonsia] crescens]|uniref:Uncharacterized protein n=1 Tax=[Emmonsia] crescens TaxID=73230 RepID=A0A0G2HXL3_9EURO|nr:hypothetical protein EMCG_02782 [Emmonsia crescens UAMH 3008]
MSSIYQLAEMQISKEYDDLLPPDFRACEIRDPKPHKVMRGIHTLKAGEISISCTPRAFRWLGVELGYKAKEQFGES